MTIDELVEKYSKECGDIRVAKYHWPKDEWFRPYYKDGSCWYGPTDTESNDSFSNSSDWHLYEEPKPKITVYEVMHQRTLGTWFISGDLREEKDIKPEWIKTGRSFEVEK